jgi:hypothetical protein
MTADDNRPLRAVDETESLFQDIAYDPLSYENLGESIARALEDRPVVPLADLPRFDGVGIYALYYKGDFPAYAPLANANREHDGSWAIYVGRKDADNARKGDPDQRTLKEGAKRGLWDRINKHRQSINLAENLDINDFSVRFLVVAPVWVSLAEIISIRDNTPVWNSLLDGFGNHSPGGGRSNMQRPKWDMVHPGRLWAAKLRENDMSRQQLEQEVLTFLNQRAR